MTFYKSTDDLPPFDDYSMAGRTYRYFEGEALYPFGHGLSYTSFDYADLRLSSADIGVAETVTIQVEVSNAGERAGDEVVQLYVADMDSSVVRPQQELRGFQRIHLAAGQSATVSFELAAAQLGYHCYELGHVVEPGDFRISAGRSSGDLPLSTTLTVTGGPASVPFERVFFSEATVVA